MASLAAEKALPATAGRQAPRAGLIYAMALFSGAAALAYEIAWAKILALTFGSTTLSAAAVIAGFMGGMGLGAWLYHYAGDRSRQPLRMYAYLEIGIAASTWALTILLFRLPHLFVQVFQEAGSDAVLIAIRFATVLALLMVPAALMGATFPALCSVLIRTARGVDRHLGMIYGINTLGAALGAVVAGVLLIERFGLRGTVLWANVTNLTIGAVALWLAQPAEAADAATASDEETAIPTELPRTITGLVLLFSGMATLSCEILWMRALRYVVGNSTYALTVVLVVFLVGLGAGALWFRRLLRWAPAERLLAAVQCGISALAMLAMVLAWLLMTSPYRAEVSVFTGALRGLPWWGKLAVNAALAAAIMLPAAVLMGLSFPLASRLFLGDVRRLGARVGSAYFLANIGSIAGSLLAAAWLLPTLGTIGGTKLIAAINLALGLLLVVWLRRRGDRSLIPLAAGTAVLVVAASIWLPSQVPLTGEPDMYARGHVVFSSEGDLATVHVLDDPARPSARAMAIDGNVIGVSKKFHWNLYRKQLLLAHLPLAIDSRIDSALQIGLGTATTLDALAGYPTIERIDCVEINQGVVDAAEGYFAEAEVLDDPRVHLDVDDALYFLLRTPQRYDLIVSDGKQNPGFSGNATMLCREFYEYSLDRLNEDGLFVQWTPLGMLSEEFQVVLRNFCDVFPEAAVFYYPETDVLFVGSRKPLAGRPRLTAAEFAALPVRKELAGYHLPSPDALLAHWFLDRGQMLEVAGPGPLSDWNHNIIEFMDFKSTAAERQGATVGNLGLMLQASRQRPAGDTALVATIDPKLYRSTRLVRDAYAELAVSRFDRARRFARMALEVDPTNSAAKAVLALIEQRQHTMPLQAG